MRTYLLVIGVLIILATGSIASAEMRTWTDKTGKHKIEAEFVEILEGKVRLKRADGKVTSVSLSMLSREDQALLKNLVKERRAAETGEAGGDAELPVAGPPRLGRGGGGGTFKNGDRVVREWAGEMQVGTVVGVDPRSGWLEVIMDGEDSQRPASMPATYFKPLDAAAKAVLPPADWAWTPPTMKPAIPADYSSVRRPTAVAPAAPLKPDPGPPTPTLTGVKASMLPLPIGFHETRQSIDVIGGGSPKALVLYRGGKEHNSADSRLEVLDLAKGERLATISAAAKTGALWASPSGKRVVTTEGSGPWDEATHVHLWELGDKSLTHLASWQPYEGNDRQNRIAWVRWIDDDRLLTKSQEGMYVAWQVGGAKAIFELNKQWSSEPAISPGGHQLAVAGDKGVEIYATDSGDHLATLPAKGGRFANVAFTPSGGRLAVLSPRGVEIFDLATAKKQTEFYIGDKVTRGNWLDERFLLVDDGKVIDSQSMCMLWQYHGGSLLGGHGAQRWAIIQDPTPGSKKAALAPIELPHPAAKQAAPQAAEALALKPGDQISIDVQGVDPQIAGESRTHLEKGLAASGFKVADGAAAKLTASTRPGESQDMNYRSFGVGGQDEKFSVTTRYYDAVLTMDGKELWKSSNLQTPPGMVSLKEGESIQEVVSREMGLRPGYFPAVIPSNIVSLRSREPLGVSQMTTNGVK